jgi:hypothetical protein
MAMPGHSINSWHHNPLQKIHIYGLGHMGGNWAHIPKTWFLAWLTLWPIRWEQYVPLKWLAFSKQHNIITHRTVLFTVTCKLTLVYHVACWWIKGKSNIFMFSCLHAMANIHKYLTIYRIPLLKWPHVLNFALTCMYVCLTFYHLMQTSFKKSTLGVM